MKMRLHYAIPVLFVFILGSCDSEAIEEETQQIEAENVLFLEGEILDLVNEHRTSIGTNDLQFNEVAYKYANSHNDYMISKGSISHDHFSSRASSIDSEVDVEMVAENVAKDYDTAKEVFDGWYNSSSHKKTMEGDFTHTAVSVKKDESGNFYFTQIFYKK